MSDESGPDLHYKSTARGGILPAIHDGNTWRFLGRIKTNRLKAQVEPFADFLQAAQIPVLDPAVMQPYERYQSAVPILDQGQVGSCVAHAHCTAVLKVRDLNGA